LLHQIPNNNFVLLKCFNRKQFNAHAAILSTLNSSANLVLQLAKPSIAVLIARRLLIISNAINQIAFSFEV
jgi:hypothetical protein